MDYNDTEYSMCFINSLGINTSAGNLSVSQSHASLNFTVITMDSASKFSTKRILVKHFFPQAGRGQRMPNDFTDSLYEELSNLFELISTNVSV